MTRLSRADWDKLDDLLGKHGLGNYYDFLECMKQIASDLGMSNVYDLDDFKTLPDLWHELRTWTTLLSGELGFIDLAIDLSEKVLKT